jgi:hypothetical protein
MSKKAQKKATCSRALWINNYFAKSNFDPKKKVPSIQTIPMEIKFYLCNAKLFKTGSAARIMTSNGQKSFVFRRSADKGFHQAINWVISYIPCGTHDKTICTTHFKPGGVSMNLLTTHKGVKHSSHILLSCNHNLWSSRNTHQRVDITHYWDYIGPTPGPTTARPIHIRTRDLVKSARFGNSKKVQDLNPSLHTGLNIFTEGPPPQHK